MPAEVLDLVKLLYSDTDEAFKAQRAYFDSLRTRVLALATANIAIAAFFSLRFAESSGSIDFHDAHGVTPDGLAVLFLFFTLLCQFAAVLPSRGWIFSFDVDEFTKEFLEKQDDLSIEEKYLQAARTKQGFFRRNETQLSWTRTALSGSLIFMFGQVLFWML